MPQSGDDYFWYYLLNTLPYGAHLFSKDSYGICSGTAWNVAKDLGLWHFIISLGALLNQDAYVLPVGYNAKPATNIKWPLDLISKSTITILPKEKTEEKPKISIVRKTHEQQSAVKKITIIKK